MDNSDSALLAYLAGILDADGAFCIHTRRYSRTRQAKHPYTPYYLQARVQIKQVQREALDLLHSRFGGRSPKIVPPTSKKGKPLFYWTVSSKKAEGACLALLPYLRLKIKQAQLLIELQKSISSTPRVKGTERAVKTRWGGVTNTSFMIVPPDVRAYRYRIFVECRHLNDTRWPIQECAPTQKTVAA